MVRLQAKRRASSAGSWATIKAGLPIEKAARDIAAILDGGDLLADQLAGEHLGEQARVELWS